MAVPNLASFEAKQGAHRFVSEGAGAVIRRQRDIDREHGPLGGSTATGATPLLQTAQCCKGKGAQREMG